MQLWGRGRVLQTKLWDPCSRQPEFLQPTDRHRTLCGELCDGWDLFQEGSEGELD